MHPNQFIYFLLFCEFCDHFSLKKKEISRTLVSPCMPAVRVFVNFVEVVEVLDGVGLVQSYKDPCEPTSLSSTPL